MLARFINILIAMWVIVAAFSYKPPVSQFVSMLIVGVLVMAFEALAFFSNRLRFVDTIVGAWLVLSAFVLPTGSDFVLWNNFFCGVAIVVLSMVRSRVKTGPWMEQRGRGEAEVR